MTSEQGTLTIQFKKNKKGNLQRKDISISFTSNQNYRFDRIPDENKNLPETHISVALLEKISAITEEGKQTWEIECDLIKQKIFKLREKGQNWDREESEEGEIPKIPERVRPQERSKNVQSDRFHNPYNFVPALPRDSEAVQKSELGDREPVGHSRYLPEYWSGRISVKLTTVTPLLIPDAAEMTEDDNGHKTYPVRLGTDGKPYLPPTSIKGMFRSAYEAVTNSRLSVLEEHKELLAYRLPPGIGIQMVPARIENGHIHLYSGTSGISSDGKPERGDPMYAAWMRRWDRGSINLDQYAVTYAGTQDLPEHGTKVKFWAEKFSKGNFSYWSVRKVVRFDQNLEQHPTPTRTEGYGQHKPTGDPMRQFEGYVCVTEKNITNKHDERIFFSTEPQEPIELSFEVRERWTKLIESYQDNDDFKNGLQCPSALRNRQGVCTARWSRHFRLSDYEKKLGEGTLCYAHVRRNGSSFKVIDLYPVMIARSLYRKTPTDILHLSLKPATNHEKLSPADRVFGWVNQDGKGSYKGQLRVHSVTCISDDNDAIDDFGSEGAVVPLAILGQPKPQQARFYCANDRNGTPLADKIEKGKGYKDKSQGLRGRKVYPHHQGLPTNYWDNPTVDRTQDPPINDHYQEYRRPRKKGVDQDDQNRSIKNWIKPGAEFKFDIDVTNLSFVELGTLLWLLSSPDIHYHRLGGGKPLGFGSVWINIDWKETDLRLGADWNTFYQSLTTAPKIGFDALTCIAEYKKAIVGAYGEGKRFEQVPFIAAFCRCSKGFEDNAAVHYPRSTSDLTPEGEAFKWFVNNEKDDRREPGLKLALPSLADPNPASLPISPIQPNPDNNRNQLNRRR
ncbi:TIGR03986 family CRISPR-associated RAMP protein [Geitlerinema splendidum]|nr:TIGR03986 family CRISPR-associated RAMP protein [Geitlerinema splendidum]